MEDNKSCDYCYKDVNKEASRCPYCRSVLTKHPLLIFMINLFLPGIGYLVKEKYAKTIITCILISVGYQIFIFPGLILHTIVLIDSLFFE